MYYKYYTYRDNGYMVKWKFASVAEIKKEAVRHPIDFFATIQNYDENGKKLNCPIYVDVDTDDKDNFESIVCLLSYAFRDDPVSYSSGHKGYHLIVPVLIEGEDCEQVVKKMLEIVISDKANYDKCVYKNRSMWRVNGAINSKSGKNKELYCNSSKLYDLTLIKKIELEARELIKQKEKEIIVEEFRNSWKEELTPCLYSAIIERPEDGEWHETLFILSRFFFICGTSIETAYQTLIDQPHFAEDKKYVRKTLENIYKWAKTGERFGTCNSIISKYCIRSICKFRGEK
jgi:hypothetical protein